MSLDAVDVAFTEAAVGAGVSTVLMLSALRLTHRFERRTSHIRPLPLTLVLVTGATLVYGTLDAPGLGDPQAPAHTHVAPRYIEQGPLEVGTPNMVTAVLASYRGYDTLGETVVIFTAGLAVLLLLGSGENSSRPEGPPAIGHQMVLRAVTKVLVPFILLFALYVQFHGDYGAGGGFQAGVIFATGFVLYDLVFGEGDMERVMPPRLLRRLAALGILLYGSVGVASMLLGHAFLDYSVFFGEPVQGQHLGVLIVEVAVGVTVFAVVLNIFFVLSGRRHQP